MWDMTLKLSQYFYIPMEKPLCCYFQVWSPYYQAVQCNQKALNSLVVCSGVSTNPSSPLINLPSPIMGFPTIFTNRRQKSTINIFSPIFLVHPLHLNILSYRNETKKSESHAQCMKLYICIHIETTLVP